MITERMTTIQVFTDSTQSKQWDHLKMEASLSLVRLGDNREECCQKASSCTDSSKGFLCQYPFRQTSRKTKVKSDLNVGPKKGSSSKDEMAMFGSKLYPGSSPT